MRAEFIYPWFVASIVAMIMLLLPGKARAQHYTGSPVLPASGSAWILIDGDDAATGTSATINAAELVASKVLRVPNESLFHFSARKLDLAALEAQLDQAARRLAQRPNRPVTVVLFIEGGSAANGPRYRKDTLTETWIAERIQTLTKALPGSLLVLVADSLATDSVHRLTKGLGRPPYRTPVMIIASEAAPQHRSTTLAEVLKDVATREGQVALLEQFPSVAHTAPVGDAATRFLAGIVGAAEDPDANGYSAIEIERWVTGGSTQIKSATAGEHLDAVAYLLKRRRHSVVICTINKERNITDQMRELVNTFKAKLHTSIPVPPEAIQFTSEQIDCNSVDLTVKYDLVVVLGQNGNQFALSVVRSFGGPGRTLELQTPSKGDFSTTLGNVIKWGERALQPPVSATEQALKFYREALKERERGHLQEAIELFQRSQDLRPSRSTLYELARSELNAGRFDEARQHFEMLLAPRDDDEIAPRARNHLFDLIRLQDGRAMVERRRLLRVAGYAAGGVGLAALVTGAVTGGLAISQKNHLDAQCRAEQCTPAGLKTLKVVRTYVTASNAAFAIGAGATAVGLSLVIPNLERLRPTAALVPSSGSVRVVLTGSF